VTDPVRTSPDDPTLDRSLGRWLAWGVVALAVLVAAFPIYRAVESGRRADALAELEAAQLVSGEQLWAANCSACHGPDGEGIDAPALNAKEFFADTTEQRTHHIAQAGIPGTEMGPWWNEFGGPLTDQQIRAIVAFIFHWQEDAPSRPDWRTPGGEHAEEAPHND